MKIIHLGNQANVAANICNGLNRYPKIEAECHNIADNHYKGFGAKVHKTHWIGMIKKLMPKLKEADIIHIHASYVSVYVLRMESPTLAGKPIVLHLHGSEIRNKFDEKRIRGLDSANKVLYSTLDLKESVDKYDLENPAVWIPNPVDKTIFKPIKPYCSNRSGILYFRTITEPLKKSQEMVELVEKEMGMPVEVIDRSKSFIPHDKMSHKLNHYEYLLDSYLPDKLSYTSLQMLATGGKVINVTPKYLKEKNIEIVKKFPEEHLLGKVARQIKNIYEDII